METMVTPAQRRRQAHRTAVLQSELQRLLSRPQVAKLLGRSTETIRRVTVVAEPGKPVRADRLRAIVIADDDEGKPYEQYYYEPEEVERFRAVPRPTGHPTRARVRTKAR